MAEVNYGLTREGFKRKRLPEIIKSLNDRVSDKLGIQIHTGSNSVFGQIHGVYAYELADLWELAEDVYHAMYPSTAIGVSLSNAAGLAGIVPITAEYTTLNVTCYGNPGTAIPYGSQVQAQSDASKVFTVIDANASIDADAANQAEVSVSTMPAEGTVYGLTIAGKQAKYTAKADDNETAVLVGVAAGIRISGVSISVTNGVLILATANRADTFAIAVNVGLTLDSVGALVRVQCSVTGAVNPVIGDVNQIITPVSGWDGVRNEIAASIGREAETDIALRQRWSSGLYARSSAMVEAVQAAIYQNVDGVTTVIVYENDSDTTDEAGRPPHSIEAVVEGGDPQDIATQIWGKRAAGIDTYGDQSFAIRDSQGVEHTMRFNRPEKVLVWMQIIVRENPDEEMAAAALQEIKEAVLSKGQTQAVGQDVILQRYFTEIFKATTGVGYIDINAAVGETAGTYSADNVAINPRQIAVLDAARIEVTKE